MRYFLQSVFSLILCTLLSYSANAQSVKANELIKNEQFSEAKYILEKLTDKNKPDYEDITNLAYCYIMEHEYLKAESTYVRIMDFNEKESIQHFYYGEVLRINGKFQKAKEQYTIYGNAHPEDYISTQRLKSCDSIPVWNKNKHDVNINNPKSINTNLEELWPWSANGSLYFTSNNKNLLEKCGGSTSFHDPQISFVYKYLNEKLQYISMSSKDSISTTAYTPRYNKEVRVVKCIRVTANGEEMSPSKIEIKEAGNWIEFIPETFDKNYTISHPCLAMNGQRMYFVSDLLGGEGGTDIYYSDSKNGIWESPVNVGKNINTTGNEMFPYITENDSSLYFASDGHPGFGNLDIFVSTSVNNVWQKPANLQKPYNSIANDFSLSFSEYPNKGYFVSNRWPESTGSYDIFEFNIPEITITLPDTTKPFVYNADNSALYVFYKTESAEINDSYLPMLDSLAALMNKYSYLSMTITACADVRGPEFLNNELIVERETSIQNYLQNKGVKNNQIICNDGAISENRELNSLNFHLQIGFVNDENGSAYYTRLFKNEYEVYNLPKYNGFAYFIGSGTLDEINQLKYQINQRFDIGAFVIATYRNQIIEDTWYAPNRRSEFYLKNN